MIHQQNIEAFTDAILRVLGSNKSPFGIEAHAFPVWLGVYGFYPDGEELVARLEYLVMKGFADAPKKEMGSTRAWKLTDKGRRYLDEHNL